MHGKNPLGPFSPDTPHTHKLKTCSTEILLCTWPTFPLREGRSGGGGEVAMRVKEGREGERNERGKKVRKRARNPIKKPY